MRLPFVWTIYRKEITEALRDRITLLMVIGLPMLLYPLLFIGITKVQKTQAATEDKRASKIAVWGAAPAPLLDWLKRTNTLTLESWSGMPDSLRRDFESGKSQPPPAGATNVAAITNQAVNLPGSSRATNAPESELLKAARIIVTRRDVDAVLIVWPGLDDAITRKGLGQLTMYFDSVRPASEKAVSRLDSELRGFRLDLLKQREKDLGLTPGFTRALETRQEDVAPSQRRAGSFLGGVLPLLLIMLSAIGALNPAIDLTAGEKDRATMQTMLCAPVTTLEIVAGKFLAVWSISLLGALANAASIGLSLGQILAKVGGLSLSPLTFLLAFACLLPITCTVSALFLAVAALGRDVKDATNFLTPTFSLLILPISVTMLPGIELTLGTSFVPLVNVALLIKALFTGDARIDTVFLVLAASALYAMLTLLFAARTFSREQILLGGKGAVRSLFTFERRDDAKATPALALTLFAVTLVAGFYGSLALEKHGIVSLILITQYACFLLPVVALAVWMKLPLRETFSLRRPHWRSVIGCVLLGASSSLAIAGFALRLLPPPESLAEGMEKMILLGDVPASLWLVWFVVAITPALCEETLFRGVILSGFRRMGPWSAILISALLFGLAHASIYRLLPTFALGVVLGYAAWRSGSIYCSILIHALNNGLIATLVHYLARQNQSGLADLTMVPWSITLAAAAVMAVGFALLRAAPLTRRC
jgi:sodium transport system permease protein